MSIMRTRVLIAMLVASVTINIALAHRLRHFNQLSGTRSDRALKTGSDVVPFEAVDLKGQTHIIAYDQASKPTVLYVFTPTCSWCLRNMENFKELVARTGTDYHFVGLSLSKEGLSEYVAAHELKVPIYTGLSKETQKSYKLVGTPQTIVVSPEGKVLQDWVGAYSGDQKSQVEAFFHVTLPGIASAPNPSDTKTGGS
jgi:peroxiredoxin